MFHPFFFACTWRHKYLHERSTNVVRLTVAKLEHKQGKLEKNPNFRKF